MPCNDYGGMPVVDRTDYKQIRFLEAALCAVLTRLDGKDGHVLWGSEGTFAYIDWKEAGIKRKDVENWWRKHKQEDKKRRRAERIASKARKQRKKLQRSGLSKLSRAEADALGVRR